jgi:hypothetical protein
MLKRLSVLIAVASITTPAFAETFVHKGITYTYSVEQRGQIRLISGQDSENRRFTLRVSKKWVDGTVNGNAVSFSTRDVVRIKPEVTVTEIAAR